MFSFTVDSMTIVGQPLLRDVGNRITWNNTLLIFLIGKQSHNYILTRFAMDALNGVIVTTVTNIEQDICSMWMELTFDSYHCEWCHKVDNEHNKRVEWKQSLILEDLNQIPAWI